MAPDCGIHTNASTLLCVGAAVVVVVAVVVVAVVVVAVVVVVVVLAVVVVVVVVVAVDRSVVDVVVLVVLVCSCVDIFAELSGVSYATSEQPVTHKSISMIARMMVRVFFIKYILPFTSF